MKKLVLALILFVCLLNTSCSLTNHVPSSQVKFLYVKVFQTLSRTEALARCRDNYGFSGDVLQALVIMHLNGYVVQIIGYKVVLIVQIIYVLKV